MVYEISKADLNELTKSTADSQDRVNYPEICRKNGIVYMEGKNLESPFTKSTSTKASLTKELQSAIDTALAKINTQCDVNLVEYTSNALGETNIYDAKLEDQLNIIGLVMAGVPSFFRCHKEGEIKENKLHTAQQIQQVFADGLQAKAYQIKKAGVLKTFIQGLNDIDTISAVDWSWYKPELQTIEIPEEFQ